MKVIIISIWNVRAQAKKLKRISPMLSGFFWPPKKLIKCVWPFLGSLTWHFFLLYHHRTTSKISFLLFFLLHLPEAWKLSIALLGKLMEKSKGYSTDKTNIWPRDIKWLFCWISFCISLFLSRPNNFVLFISLRTKVSGLERIKYFCLKYVHNVFFSVWCRKIRTIYLV